MSPPTSPGCAHHPWTHCWRGRYAKHANKLTYGTGMLAAAAAAKQPETATKCHFFSHRYANETETIRDRMIYHCGVLLEWDHGNFASVVELAWMGGLGGYGGKSNWYDDKDSERTGLYSAMPDELKLPWDSSLAEVRVLDVAAKNGEEFLTYLTKYNGPTLRFLDAKIVESADVRRTCTSSHLLAPPLLAPPLLFLIPSHPIPSHPIRTHLIPSHLRCASRGARASTSSSCSSTTSVTRSSTPSRL
jgi:hypothetical protein